jgi:hypothetical protein
VCFYFCDILDYAPPCKNGIVNSKALRAHPDHALVANYMLMKLEFTVRIREKESGVERELASGV